MIVIYSTLYGKGSKPSDLQFDIALLQEQALAANALLLWIGLLVRLKIFKVLRK